MRRCQQRAQRPVPSRLEMRTLTELTGVGKQYWRDPMGAAS